MRERRSAVLTAALTVLSVGALLCCGAAAADEPGADLRAAETTAVYSAASGLSVTDSKRAVGGCINYRAVGGGVNSSRVVCGVICSGEG